MLGVQVGPQVAVDQHKAVGGFPGDYRVGIAHSVQDRLQGGTLGVGVAPPVSQIRDQIARAHLAELLNAVSDRH